MKQAANQSGSIRFIMMLSQRPEGTPQSKGGKPLRTSRWGSRQSEMASELSQSETGVNRSSAGATVFYFSCVTALISFAVLLAAAVLRGAWSLTAVSGQRFVNPNAMEFAALAAIGVLGGCGRILMTHCCRFAEASILAPFDYVSMLWATILGFLLFFEVPSESVLVGGGIVIAAGIVVIWRERNAWDVAAAARTSV